MKLNLTLLRSIPPRLAATGACLGGVFLWSYWPTLREIVAKWLHDPQYSHAYFVPVFALVLLWLRRGRFNPAAAAPNWWGAVLVLLGVAARFAGTYLYFGWLEAASMLVVLAGGFLLLGGWTALRWAWLPIAFLVFMIPLPYRVETGLAHPLQRLATGVGTYTLQTLGWPAVSEGNVIRVNEATIGIVEACSGLGMLLLFFALATAVAILIKRTALEKALIVASAAPVAVAANILRILVTAILYETAGAKWGDLVFHDLAGLLMMPLALGMLWVELWVLSRLLVERPTGRHELAAFPGPLAVFAGTPQKTVRAGSD